MDQLVADFLGDDVTVRAMVNKYMVSRPSPSTADASSSLSSGTAYGTVGAAAGHEASSRDLSSVKGSGLSSTGGRTLVDMQEHRVRGPTCIRHASLCCLVFCRSSLPLPCCSAELW